MFTTESLLRVEQELKVDLPLDYQTVLLAYPFGPASEFYDYDLLGDAEALIERNQGHRTHGYFGQDWPVRYLAIGSDGTDNDYFLDLETPTSAVYQADHERTSKSKRLEFEEKAVDVTAFVKWLKEQAADFEREEQQAANRHLTRKWWQFWQ